MMGLLDALTNMSPAMQQGLLATGLGMLANNRGGVSTSEALGQGGLLGMNAYASANEQQRQAEQDKLKAAMMQQQMAQTDAETQMKQQQLAQSIRQMNMQQGILAQLGFGGAQPDAQAGMQAASAPAALSNVGGSALSGALAGATPAAPAAPAILAAPAAGGMGGMQAGSGAAGGGGPLANLSESQKVRMGLDLAFNQGKTMADIAKPNMSVENGIVVDMNRMQPGETLPQPDGTQWRPLGNGQYQLTMAPGAADVLAQKRDIQNAGETVGVLNDQGQTVLVPKTQSAGRVTALNPAQQNYLNSQSDRDIKKLGAYQDAREAAPGAITTYQQLGGALEAFAKTGTSPKTAAMEQWARQNVPGYTGGSQSLQPYQVASALSNQLALELRNPASGAGMPGSMSDGDRTYLASMVANPGTDITAARTMIDARMRTLQRQQEVGTMASRWAKQYGQLSGINPKTGMDFYDSLDAWSAKNPLFPQQQAGAAPGAQ
jgi:hypothetical protein